MKIGIDAMGGDFAPEECIKAVVQEANSEKCEEHFFVFGEEAALKPYDQELEHSRITLIYTGDSIGMSEHPTKAFASKKDVYLRCYL